VVINFDTIRFDAIRGDNIFVRLQQVTADLLKKEKVQKVVQNKPSGKYAYVIPYRLNVRSQPSDEGDIVGVLEESIRIEIIGSTGRWRKIKFKNIEGYVVSDFLRQ
jgi:uncharacterized protein YgiM (DUF1202 family)